MASKRKRPALTAEQRAAKQRRDREYRARKVAGAKARGESTRAAYGHARAARPRRVIEGPGGEKLYRTGSKAVVLKLLRDAAAKGETISFRGTFQTRTGYRHATLDGSTSKQRQAFDELTNG